MRCTKHLLLMVFAVCGLALSACTSAQLKDPATVFGTAESGYAAALAAELTWLNTMHPNPGAIAVVEAVRSAAHQTLAPIEAQIAAGQVPTSDQALAAQAAVNALTTMLQTQGAVK